MKSHDQHDNTQIKAVYSHVLKTKGNTHQQCHPVYSKELDKGGADHRTTPNGHHHPEPLYQLSRMNKPTTW